MADPSRNAPIRAVLPWAAASAIVLAVAITAGFVVAFLVASGRAADVPSAAASPTPRRTPIVSLAPGQTPQQTDAPTAQPRRTPTPAPVVTPEASPFPHTIARGESLTYIAGLYCTSVEAISELNGITNPDRIQVGQVILIPGGGCAP